MVFRRWLLSDQLHGRDIFLISVPLVALVIVASDLMSFIDHGGANHPPFPYENGGWAWRSREAFILNHVIHIALPVLAVAPYLLVPRRFFRPAGRCLTLAYNAALLAILVHAIALKA